MSKSNLLKWNIRFLVISLLVQLISTGLLDLWDAVYPIHIWNGRILFLLVLAHLYLNWSWIKKNIFSR